MVISPDDIFNSNDNSLVAGMSEVHKSDITAFSPAIAGCGPYRGWNLTVIAYVRKLQAVAWLPGAEPHNSGS